MKTINTFRALVLLAILLSGATAQAQTIKSTFVFDAPYTDSEGRFYGKLSFYTPAKYSEVFLISARLEGYGDFGLAYSLPLYGSCEKLENIRTIRCQFQNPFVSFASLIYLDGRNTWGTVDAISGIFGEGVSNDISLESSGLLP